MTAQHESESDILIRHMNRISELEKDKTELIDVLRRIAMTDFVDPLENVAWAQAIAADTVLHCGKNSDNEKIQLRKIIEN